MSKRELLEACARVTGRNLISGSKDNERGVFTTLGWWNPVDDDGDCARMEAQMLVRLTYGSDTVHASIGHRDCGEWVGDHDNDRNKARRMASCRAVAAMEKL